MKKIIAGILLTFIFTFSFAICASADGTPVTDGGEALDTSDGSITEKAEDKANGDNFFVAVYSAFSDYVPEILSALAFIGSLVLAFFYKKGLLPVVKASLTGLTGIVRDVKLKAEENETISRELSNTLKERLAAAEGVLGGLRDKFTELEAALSCAEERSLDREKMTLIMTTQIELLYDIFMSSSIPQFQKEIVGESVAKMKEALKDDEDCKS